MSVNANIIRKLVLMLAAGAATVAMASAQVARPVSPLGPSIGSRPGIGEALIAGVATDARSLPVPNATVRLRNLLINQVEHVSVANHAGEYAFAVKANTPYVVEVTDKAGRVLAVGGVVTAQGGDVALANVAVPARAVALTGMLGETASTVASAVTNTAVTIAAPAPPLSPER